MHATQSVQTQVRAEIKGPVGYLILDRPERKNALSFDMWKEVTRLINEFGANRALRVVVLRGARDLPFCSGADISEFETVRANAEGARAYEDANVVAFDAIAACPLPTIAMIRSFCMGGGMGLAAACDLRVAAESAEFAIPPGKLGLAYPPSAIRYIVAAIGASNAKDLLYSARRVKAVEAEKLGLINKLTEEDALESEVEKLASVISENAPLSLKAGKLAINYAAGYEFAQDMKAVKDAADRCFDSADYREGRSAFLEKRKAQFKGE
ncbi:MAG: enoyl-CoA hydratase/isomerase family protein [Xanthobacteraceae bacterium]|nr:enoyl-CoA hydratase/isomerase family protein [Xanthobacteraceae bacterium]MCW5679468.1 enoyl-CoA hydratase/isomerase family protein [Xanthobacteraceae bacterium]